MSEKNNIELRSEKVLNIIGKIPSRIVRIGISVIFIVMLSLFGGAFFFKFDHVIDVDVCLYSVSNEIHYTVEIPQKKMKHVRLGQKLIISVHDQISMNTNIQNVDTTLYMNSNEVYSKIYGKLTYRDLKINELVKVKAKIYIRKTNIVDYLLDK